MIPFTRTGRCLLRASSTDDIGPSTNAAGSHWLTAGVRRIYTSNAALTGRSLRSRYGERMKPTTVGPVLTFTRCDAELPAASVAVTS